MKITKGFSLLATLNAMCAMAMADMEPYMLPDNLPSGLYTVDLRETNRTLNHIGNHTINPQSHLNETTNKWLGGGSIARQNNKRWVTKLPDSMVHKCSQQQLNWKHYDQVRQGFSIYANQHLLIPAHHVFVYSFEETVGYVCAGDLDATMSLKEWNAVNQVMDAFCGSEFADHRYGGKVVLKEWQRQYGRTKKGGSICGKARPGPEICPDRNELCRHR